MSEVLRKLLDFNRWANRRVLECLRSTGTKVEQARRVFAHIVAVERLWLDRMQSRDTMGFIIWPDWSLAECEAHLEENHRSYEAFLTTLDETDLSRVVTYRNTAGKEFQTAIGNILLHVFLHGAYHRGQIARLVREAGGEPVPTDYIVYARGG